MTHRQQAEPDVPEARRGAVEHVRHLRKKPHGCTFVSREP